MPTIKTTTPPTPESLPPLSIRELTGVLVKHYGINEGLYDLIVEFHLGMGVFGPNPEESGPGAMLGVSKVSLVPAQVSGPLTVDAAIVNPKKKSTQKSPA